METIVNIEGNYPNFDVFYHNNRFLIFEKLINGYRDLSNNLENIIKVNFKCTINNVNFNSTFVVDKNNDEIIERLNNVYIPFYEQNEQYEVCDEIRKIYKKIKG